MCYHWAPKLRSTSTTQVIYIWFGGVLVSRSISWYLTNVTTASTCILGLLPFYLAPFPSLPRSLRPSSRLSLFILFLLFVFSLSFCLSGDDSLDLFEPLWTRLNLFCFCWGFVSWCYPSPTCGPHHRQKCGATVDDTWARFCPNKHCTQVRLLQTEQLSKSLLFL